MWAECGFNLAVTTSSSTMLIQDQFSGSSTSSVIASTSSVTASNIVTKALSSSVTTAENYQTSRLQPVSSTAETRIKGYFSSEIVTATAIVPKSLHSSTTVLSYLQIVTPTYETTSAKDYFSSVYIKIKNSSKEVIFEIVLFQFCFLFIITIYLVIKCCAKKKKTPEPNSYELKRIDVRCGNQDDDEPIDSSSSSAQQTQGRYFLQDLNNDVSFDLPPPPPPMSFVENEMQHSIGSSSPFLQAILVKRQQMRNSSNIK